MYTRRELFDLGRAFAWACDALGDPHPTLKEEMEGLMYPHRAVTQLILQAQAQGVLSRTTDNMLTLALGRVQHIFSQPVPLELRMDWIRGYYAAKRGLSLAVARKRKGLSQAQLAEQAGTFRETVSRWESGESMPTRDYELKLRELIGWDG